MGSYGSFKQYLWARSHGNPELLGFVAERGEYCQSPTLSTSFLSQ